VRYFGDLPNYPFLRLFERLSANVIVDVFLCILLEYKVVFQSSMDLAMPSIIQTFSDLLYPLKWRHVYIPYLPENMAEILEVPVPCLMGMRWKR